MSSVGMGILLSAKVTSEEEESPLYIHMKEGPFPLDANGCITLKHWPVDASIKKTFIFEYARDAV